MIDISTLVRSHLRDIQPYSSARDEFKGRAEIFLDANENAFGSAAGASWNRYPDPYQNELKEKIADLKEVSPHQVFLGNGSDEPIDLLIRLFCEPGKDAVMTFPPTYSMYEISSKIHGVRVDEVRLTKNFELDTAAFDGLNRDHKVVFICAPNNPSGNLMKRSDILHVVQKSKGIVVVDEAYIDFVQEGSMLPFLKQYSNLVVLQTFSKAWGMAGFRLGVAYAHPQIIGYLNKIKAPYNVSGPIQQQAVEALDNVEKVKKWVIEILAGRQFLLNELTGLDFVEKVFPSDANFLLVRFIDAKKVHHFLKSHHIVVRDRSGMPLCDNCLRITVGTQAENKQLINTLRTFSND